MLKKVNCIFATLFLILIISSNVGGEDNWDTYERLWGSKAVIKHCRDETKPCRSNYQCCKGLICHKSKCMSTESIKECSSDRDCDKTECCSYPDGNGIRSCQQNSCRRSPFRWW